MGRHAAADHGSQYFDLNLMVAHLGGGISVTVHRQGRMVDISGGLYAGTFSPERSCTLPLLDVMTFASESPMQKKKLGKN